MTVLEKMIELARKGYFVTISPKYGGNGIVIGVGKGMVRINHTYTFNQIAMLHAPMETIIMTTIDDLVWKLNRRVSALDSTIWEGEKYE